VPGRKVFIALAANNFLVWEGGGVCQSLGPAGPCTGSVTSPVLGQALIFSILFHAYFYMSLPFSSTNLTGRSTYNFSTYRMYCIMTAADHNLRRTEGSSPQFVVCDTQCSEINFIGDLS
jgi:hypothetical protein